MSDELTPEQRFALDDPSVVVPRELSKGTPRDAIVQDLVDRYEWRLDTAQDYVDRFEAELERYHASPESRRELLREYKRYTVTGLLVMLVAVGLSVISLIAGELPGGIVFHGAMISGLLLFTRGVAGWQRYRRDPQ